MPPRFLPDVRILRPVLLPVFAGLLATLLFISCEALPTDPSMDTDRPDVGAERFDGRATASALPAGLQVTSGTTSYRCILSSRTDAADAPGAIGPAYTYRYVGLAFDESFAESAAGEVMTLTYRLRDERGYITRQATCRLPESLQAQALLSSWLFPKENVRQGERLQFVRENKAGLFMDWDDLIGQPCTACGEEYDCVWTSCDDLPDGEFCETGGICYPVDDGDDDEGEEPIDDPGGGGDPWDNPTPGDGDDFPEDGGGGGGGTPPSDDCPDDNDDTPAPPEGGDEPCDFDCWDPPNDDDDPFNPPGFMSVQSWQTTSSGMAVAVYMLTSSGCPGEPMDFSYEEEVEEVIDCDDPSTPQQQAVCDSELPDSAREAEIVSAFNRMEARGPECQAIANHGEQLLQGDKIRIFDGSYSFQGLYGGPESGIYISAKYVDTYTDPENALLGQFNLDWIMAHEIDHAMGHSHILGDDGQEIPAHTPHSMQCSGIEYD